VLDAVSAGEFRDVDSIGPGLHCLDHFHVPSKAPDMQSRFLQMLALGGSNSVVELTVPFRLWLKRRVSETRAALLQIVGPFVVGWQLGPLSPGDEWLTGTST
jgi:hypothetical protein